jgi:predicted nucleic acid-binding protein
MAVKRLRVYADTSVIGGYYDPEFQKDSKLFWNSVMKGDFILVISEITLQELTRAPEHVRSFVKTIPEEFVQLFPVSDEARELALSYIRHGALPEDMENDALHIALATIAEVDAMISWNFKHVVNLGKIRVYNGVNLEMGYRPIEIRTPKEVIQVEE